jgi:glycosyltransferase involved in cell wall biosynthesis
VPRLPNKVEPTRDPHSTLKDRRIVFLLFNLELGGAERQALILAKHLVQREGAVVEVCGFNKSGPVADMCEELGVPWRIIPYSLNSRAEQFVGLTRVQESLRRRRPDVLLPYTFVPNVIGGLLWKLTGAQACVWNQRDEGVTPFVAQWSQAAARRTPIFISNSLAGAEFLVRELEVEPAKVRMIENGIEPRAPKSDRSSWRAELAVGDDTFVACMVANLHDNKDHRTLLRAWKRVVDRMDGRKPVLVLAGRHDGAYESLTSLALELKLNGHVRFAGQVLDVPGLLSAADLAVFSSHIEGCPNGVLESMAAGLAVAGTDIAAIRSVIGPAGTQFLAPPKDDESLAAAILQLADDAELRGSLGTRNRQRVADHYEASRMCESTVAVLKEVLNGQPAR